MTDDFAASIGETAEQAARADGAAILDRAVRLITTYIALPTREAADALALWAAATHALPALSFAPRLAVRSATKRAGKSRVLDVVSALAHHPLRTVNASVPAIFRSLDTGHPRTLVFDEADTIFGTERAAENNEDLRGLINAGFERGNPTLRCVGPQQVPTEFASFAMAALAGIGTLPDTIEDRSIIVRIKRRKPNEVIKPFRARRDRPAVEAVGSELAAWLGSDAARRMLESAEPESELEDRDADTWESLFAVADLAGEQWSERARQAARVLTAEGAEDENEVTLGVRLLHDVYDLFDSPLVQGEFVPTSVLIQHLKAVEGAPWSDMDLTAHRLGRELKGFGIKSRHDSTKTKRGYYRSHFADAWERYPKPSDPDAHSGADHASEASTTVHTGNELRKQTDTSTDALDGRTEASVEVSHQNTSSDTMRTYSDASDASPDGTRTDEAPDTAPSGTDCDESQHHETCLECTQRIATPLRMRADPKYCTRCRPQRQDTQKGAA